MWTFKLFFCIIQPHWLPSNKKRNFEQKRNKLLSNFPTALNFALRRHIIRHVLYEANLLFWALNVWSAFALPRTLVEALYWGLCKLSAVCNVTSSSKRFMSNLAFSAGLYEKPRESKSRVDRISNKISGKQLTGVQMFQSYWWKSRKTTSLWNIDPGKNVWFLAEKKTGNR